MQSFPWLGRLQEAALVVDQNGNILFHNAVLLRMVDAEDQDFIGCSIIDVVPGLKPLFKFPLAPQLKSQAQVDGLIEVNGRRLNCFLYPEIVKGDATRSLILIGLEQADQMFQSVLDSIPSRVFWKNRELHYEGCNQLFAMDAGVGKSANIIGKTDFDLAWTPEQAQQFRSDDLEVIQTGVSKLDYEELQNHPDGGTYWLQTCKIPLRDSAGNVMGVIGTYTDITERKAYQQEMEYQAYHDSLTGLPNRRQLTRELGDLMGKTRTGVSALFFVDLDYFKTVNDTLGHQLGDQILKQVAARICSVVGDKALVCRLGGDEFGILSGARVVDGDVQEMLEQCNATQIAKDLILSLMLPFKVEHHTVSLGASIGISLIASRDSDGHEKLRQADIAMFVAKEKGRNQFCFYTPELGERISGKHDLQIQLKQAIKNQELAVYFQPQLNANHEVIGAEALVRWFHPEVGYIPPNTFITIAEQTGQIYSIGQWVMAESFRMLKEWRKKLPEDSPFILAMNVSPKQFEQQDFIANVQRMLVKFDLEPRWIQLEITESLLVVNAVEVEAKLNSLRRLGFTVAIDDFGTGFSSLSYLAKLPLDKLKIDKSFICDIKSDTKCATIVETIILMAEKLGLSVIAEGVETMAQRAFLLDHGCQEFQGYLYSPAIEHDAFEQLLLGKNIVPQQKAS